MNKPINMAGTLSKKKSGIANARIIGATILAAIGVTLSFILKTHNHLGETSFASLLAFFPTLGVFIAFLDKFESVAFGLTGVNAKLRKMEDTKNEVSELARLTVEFVLLQTEHTLTFGAPESNPDLDKTISRILELTDGDDNEIVRRYKLKNENG